MSLVPRDATPALRRIEQLLDAGQFQDALQDIEAYEQQDSLSDADQLTHQLLKSQFLLRLNDYEAGLQLAEAVLQESQQRNMQ